jgi:hypothetical protein
VLAQDIRPAGGDDEAVFGFRFGRTWSAVPFAVVDYDLQRATEFFKPINNPRKVEVVSNDANLGFVLDRLVKRQRRSHGWVSRHAPPSSVRPGKLWREAMC